MDSASAYYIAPLGRIDAGWEKTDENIILTLSVPAGTVGTIKLPGGYTFADGENTTAVKCGKFTVIRTGK